MLKRRRYSPHVNLDFVNFILSMDYIWILDKISMDERLFNNFLIGKGKWVIYVLNAYLYHFLLGVCCRGIYHNKLKSYLSHMSPFSSQDNLLVHFLYLIIYLKWYPILTLGRWNYVWCHHELVKSKHLLLYVSKFHVWLGSSPLYKSHFSWLYAPYTLWIFNLVDEATM